MLTQTKEIYGSARFLFSKDQLQALHIPSGGTSGSPVHVTACVTSSFSEFKVNRTVEVQIMPDTYQLIFYDFPPSLRPTLHFFSKLRISRFDRTPLSSQDLMYSAVVEISQRQSTMNTESTTLMVPVPKDGNVHISFILQEQVEMLFIRARFQSSEEILSVYKNYSSPSGSYIQISPITTLPAQIGLALQIDVESTFKPIMLHFVVSSRGQVVAAGSKNSSSFFLTPTLSWTPEAFVTVYCIPSVGEISIDTAHIPIKQPNDVSLKWSNDQARPGQQVSLSVNTLEPRSQVGIVVMGTHDDSTPEDEQDLKTNQGSNIKMLTNARLHQKKAFNGSKEVDALLVKYWSPWLAAAETMLWLDTNVRDKIWTSEKITVPDGVTALRAAALVMSDSLGLGFTPVPLKLTVSKDFSLSLNVPAYLIRGEEIVLEVNIINHLEQDIEVIILLAQSNSFEFVLGGRGEVPVINAQKLNPR
ncbi:CD109 antigen-like [Echeneis naucrates]|uniref:CD109 antigen-like n=1 Tax=Echeneis naucrates TaxID=173247 RepID=UPI001113D229|nr:CD109 antigen-like [Echeneis naucrates]